MLTLLLSTGLALGAGMAAHGDARGGAPDVEASAEPDLAWLAPAFTDAAARWQVPEPLLLALAWEASHWQPEVASQWGGYGLFDLREEDGGPGPRIEDAAILLGVSPDDIIASPALQVQAAAALLARTARVVHDGETPEVDALEDWWEAVASFSGRHEPNLQELYTRTIYEVVATGVERGGLVLPAHEVDPDLLVDLLPPPTTCDYSGCYQYISASSANYSNYSRDASDISYVVIHTVQGSYSGCISWFQNSSASVSAHYVVRSSDGQVTQMVKEEDVAWHAGNWDYNLASVGIEHEGYVDDPDTWYTDAMYAGSAALTADIMARNGIPASRSYIIAHSEVPGATHTDPGSGWDWDYYMDLLSGGSVTGDLLGVVRDTDIYDADANLVGATVWIAETGETTTVGSDGRYEFNDLALETYTVWASYPGYEDGSCTKALSSGDNWCSIALLPAEDDPGDGGATDGGSEDGGATDGGGGDGGATGDGGSADGGAGEPDEDPAPPPVANGQPPGSAVELSRLHGGCAAAPGGAGLVGLLAGLLAVGRRRARR